MPPMEETLATALEPHRGVVSAYLFGSFADGRSHAESDVDVGVLLDRDEHPASTDRFEVRVRLSAQLEHDLAPRLPDVVILNEAPPTMAAHIVTTGRRVLCRNMEKDHAFRRDIQLRAADLQPFLRRARGVKLSTILER